MSRVDIVLENTSKDIKLAAGYQNLLKDDKPPPDSLKCPLCKYVLKKPLQTTRGEIACSACYYYHKGNKDTCPLDNQPIANDQIFNDKAKEREVLNLFIKCSFVQLGCVWEGQIRNLEEHLLECKFSPHKCTYCEESVVSLQDHYKECKILTNEKKCPYHVLGCKAEVRNHNEKTVHITNFAVFHATLFTGEYHKELTQQKAINKGIQRQLEDQKQSNKILKQQLKETNTRVEELETKLQLFLTKIEENECMNSSTNNNTSKTSTKTDTDNGEEDVAQLSAAIRSSKQEINQITKSVANLNSNIADLDLRHQLHENSTDSGTMIWKIDRYSHRLQQAISGATTALHSAPSFTKKYGYKYCCRAYLYGDGSGKGTHMSLFFVLMKSEFDNLLTFPFSSKIAFTLINQLDRSQSIKETFTADPKSSSFQKPKKQMNVASGCPLFVKLEALKTKGFIVDDSIFLEITIT